MIKFSVEYKKLQEAVAASSKAVAAKPANPIMANLLMIVSDGKLRIVGCDNEIMMISNIEANIEESGSFTIPAKLVQDILSSVSVEISTLVSFEVLNDETGETEINCGPNKFLIQIQGTEDYPPIPVIGGEETKAFQIKCEGMKRAMKESSISVGTEASNPVQKSLLVDFTDAEKPVMASTDSKRLSVTTIRDIEIPEELRKSYLVPARAVAEIQKLLDGESIMMGLYKDQLLFSTEKCQFLTRLVEGTFPPYSRIIPRESSHSVTFKRKALIQAIKAAGLAAKGAAGLIRLEIGANETKIWAESKEYGRAESYVPSVLTGEPISIAFNSDFMLDFLNVLDDEEAVIEMTTASYPGLLRPGNMDSEFKYVLMPMTY